MSLLLRELRRRIKSIQNIQKITRAMMLISAAKLKKNQIDLENLWRYCDVINKIVEHTIKYCEADHILYKSFCERGNKEGNLFGVARISQKGHLHAVVKDTQEEMLLVIVGSERGLCGTLNTNLAKFVSPILNHACKIIIVGKRIYTLIKKYNPPIIHHYPMPDKIEIPFIENLSKFLLEEYVCNEKLAIWAVYTQFISSIKQQPIKQRLLPVSIQPQVGVEPIWEPNSNEILDNLLSIYLQASVWRILLEAQVSEHAARFLAMQQATTNANNLIAQLRLSFNKARQESITKELLDIINTSEAVKS